MNCNQSASRPVSSSQQALDSQFQGMGWDNSGNWGLYLQGKQKLKVRYQEGWSAITFDIKELGGLRGNCPRLHVYIGFHIFMIFLIVPGHFPASIHSASFCQSLTHRQFPATTQAHTLPWHILLAPSSMKLIPPQGSRLSNELDRLNSITYHRKSEELS